MQHRFKTAKESPKCGMLTDVTMTTQVHHPMVTDAAFLSKASGNMYLLFVAFRGLEASVSFLTTPFVSVTFWIFFTPTL